MRRGIVICLFAFVLAGCASGPGTVPTSTNPGGSGAPSSEASGGVDVPPDDPSLQRDDEQGSSPDQSVLALIDALNKTDWRTAYSSYASPSVDLATASREWADAHETYLDFRVLEVRVTAADTAWVHVTYAVSSNPSSSVYQPVTLEEWWPVHKVEGAWKTRWMPR